MVYFLRFAIVGCCWLLAVLQGSGVTRAETMDEMISKAADNSENFAFFQGTEEKPTIRVELDMVFTPEQWDTIQKDLGVYGDEPGREKRKAIRSATYRWPGGVIPYELAPGVFTSSQQGQINAAIQEWQTYTCLKFQRASYSTRDKIRFDNGGGCFSNVGKVGGAQTVGLAPGCRYKGVVVHEIGHAVGFQHEQTRPDRDDYVQIIRGNIPSHLYYNFQKYSRRTVNDHQIPYDYYSIMHYGPKAFSVNGGLTIRTRDPKYQNVIGNRQGMSFRDIKLANSMYQCSAKCSNKDVRCPGEGFVDKNCRCMCPGSPVRECTDVSTGGTTTGIRTTTTSGPVVENKCQDRHQSCSSWARRGECSKNEAYMLTFCKKSCNVCDERKSCKDVGKHCTYWKGKGYCRYKYVTYMRTNCPKSCNTCDQVDDDGVNEAGNGSSGVTGDEEGNSAVTSLPRSVPLVGVVVAVLCGALL